MKHETKNMAEVNEFNSILITNIFRLKIKTTMWIFSPLFVEEFIHEMSEFYGVSVHEDFKRYTYGSSLNLDLSTNKSQSKIHRKMSLEELKNYL